MRGGLPGDGARGTRPRRPRRLRDELGAGRDGTSAHALVLAAERHGMRVRAHRAAPDSLTGLSSPLIAHWELGHYVVVEDVGERHARIVDPLTGRRRIPREEFDRSFSGVVLPMAPGPDFTRARPPRGEVPRFLWGRLPRSPGLIGTVLALSVLLTGLGALPALFTRHLIDEIVPAGSDDLLVTVGLGWPRSWPDRHWRVSPVRRPCCGCACAST